MFSDMLLHDTVLARSFCLISWLKRAGVAGSSASLSLFAADCVCIPDSPSFIQHYISHLSTYSSITSPLPARLAIVAGPAYPFYSHFLPVGPACHCGRSRLLLSTFLLRSSFFSPQILLELPLFHQFTHILSVYLPTYPRIIHYWARLVIVAYFIHSTLPPRSHTSNHFINS